MAALNFYRMNSVIECFIKEGYKVFDGYDRPDIVVDHGNDLEYTEYSISLEGVCRDQLTIEHIGHICWGPLYALEPLALAHYMPRLIEFSILGIKDKSSYPFMLRLVDVLEPGPESERLMVLGSEQAQYLLRVLYFLKSVYLAVFKEHLYEGELNNAILIFRKSSLILLLLRSQ